MTIAVLVAGCGGDSSSQVTAKAAPQKADSGPTRAILHPLGGSGVSGRVDYVKQSSGQPLMKIRLQGVHKATGETQYFIWQMESRHNMTSFASYYVPHGTELSVNLEPNLESLAWLEEGSTTKMLITRVKNDDRFFASQGHWRSAADPSEIGTPVSRGTFSGPLVGPSAG